jgi:hypothetical protein
MKFIAHRGLLLGKNPDIENLPGTIDHAIEQGFDVEIDLRKIGDSFYLGHDQEQMRFIDFKFITDRAAHLWVHAKNLDVFDYLYDYRDSINYFWHTDEAVVITSHGTPWAFPGNFNIRNGIAVCPEYKMNYKEAHRLPVQGICSHHIQEIATNYWREHGS